MSTPSLGVSIGPSTFTPTNPCGTGVPAGRRAQAPDVAHTSIAAIASASANVSGLLRTRKAALSVVTPDAGAWSPFHTRAGHVRLAPAPLHRQRTARERRQGRLRHHLVIGLVPEQSGEVEVAERVCVLRGNPRVVVEAGQAQRGSLSSQH